ncbi:MAG: hypothetical protein J0G30_11355 [Actinomycetales bacterium]|nr:hypothetical protein [Actinomycetales bacterium]
MSTGRHSASRPGDPQAPSAPHDGPAADRPRDPLVEHDAEAAGLERTATNDAVAGETIADQPGSGWGGPTGGNEREAEPILHEHDDEHDDPAHDPEEDLR